MNDSKAKKLLLLGLGLLLPMLAAKAARTVAGRGYRLATSSDPPKNPANREVEWKEAIIWTMISGALGGLARMLVRRQLAGSTIPSEGYDLEEKAEEIA